ncbi:zincin [Lepidopterella palustris CBS 459.81]|uniref:Zincin n=1 Tax=Lepidopterella palustris CBS 459.81 TaxID=1314670 RepID=A0A8E2JJU9_9PEZI|nr:zincin [Lepidopterella palustris CBS 459.81]
MCCSIVSPSLLQSIADDESLDGATRESALYTLQSTEALRQATDLQKAAEAVSTGHLDFRCAIYSMSGKAYDASGTAYAPLPGIPLRTSEEPPTFDEDVNNCLEGLRMTYNFYKEVFGRNSIDGNGMQINASVFYAIRYGNAMWVPNAKQMVFGSGDGNTRFGRYAGIFKQSCFTSSLDVIGHELTHAVTESTAGLKYEGQAGALNESVSDVFGCMIKQYALKQKASEADWLVGMNIIYEHVFPDTPHMRSLADPESDKVIGKQPKHMKSKYYRNENPQASDHGGVHTNSGVPNHAFYKIAVALGGFSWERAGKVWYATLTDSELRKNPYAKFELFARLTLKHAESLFPGSEVVEAVRQAWRDVGVL